MRRRSYETADVINEATTKAGRKLEKKEADTLDKVATKIRKKQAKVAPKKTTDEQIADIESQIEKLHREVKANKKIEKSEKQKRLEQLKDIRKDQDRIFELLRVLREGDLAIDVKTAVEDPVGYKQTIKALMDEVKQKRSGPRKRTGIKESD